jgi:hypothetical protein
LIQKKRGHNPSGKPLLSPEPQPLWEGPGYHLAFLINHFDELVIFIAGELYGTGILNGC